MVSESVANVIAGDVKAVKSVKVGQSKGVLVCTGLIGLVIGVCSEIGFSVCIGFGLSVCSGLY